MGLASWMSRKQTVRPVQPFSRNDSRLLQIRSAARRIADYVSVVEDFERSLNGAGVAVHLVDGHEEFIESEADETADCRCGNPGVYAVGFSRAEIEPLLSAIVNGEEIEGKSVRLFTKDGKQHVLTIYSRPEHALDGTCFNNDLMLAVARFP